MKSCSHCGSQLLCNPTRQIATCDNPKCEMSNHWLSFDTWNNRPLEDELVRALERMLRMYEMMMKQANHRQSAYTGEYIREMNEAPGQAQIAIDNITKA